MYLIATLICRTISLQSLTTMACLRGMQQIHIMDFPRLLKVSYLPNHFCGVAFPPDSSGWWEVTGANCDGGCLPTHWHVVFSGLSLCHTPQVGHGRTRPHFLHSMQCVPAFQNDIYIYIYRRYVVTPKYIEQLET